MPYGPGREVGCNRIPAERTFFASLFAASTALPPAGQTFVSATSLPIGPAGPRPGHRREIVQNDGPARQSDRPAGRGSGLQPDRPVRLQTGPTPHTTTGTTFASCASWPGSG